MEYNGRKLKWLCVREVCEWEYMTENWERKAQCLRGNFDLATFAIESFTLTERPTHHLSYDIARHSHTIREREHKEHTAWHVQHRCRSFVLLMEWKIQLGKTVAVAAAATTTSTAHGRSTGMRILANSNNWKISSRNNSIRWNENFEHAMENRCVRCFGTFWMCWR